MSSRFASPFMAKSPLAKKNDPPSSLSAVSGLIGKVRNVVVDKIRKGEVEDLLIPQKIQNLIPTSVRAFGSDIAQNLLGVENKGDITEKHLSNAEKKALENARIRAQEKGRNYITYDDYDTVEVTGDNSKYKDIGGAGFISGWGGNVKNEDTPGFVGLLKKTFNPNYSMKTALGAANFKQNDDGTYTYTDQYDFNDAKEGGIEAYKREVAERELSGNPLTAYQKLRLLAKYQGSAPGEGANVNIKI